MIQSADIPTSGVNRIVPFANVFGEAITYDSYSMFHAELERPVNNAILFIPNNEEFHSTYEIIEATDPWED